MSLGLSQLRQDRLVAGIRDDPRVEALYIFGSRARGEARHDSDLDVAALLRQPTALHDLVEIEDRVSNATGMHVDLIDLRTAGAYLALDAVAGERVHCRDADLCDEFELYVLRRAGDLAPFERERRSMLLEPPGHGAPRRAAS